MIKSIKKKILNLLNNIGYKIGFFIYGKITESIEIKNTEAVKVLESNFDKNYIYKIYKIKNCRIYTDTVTDTAFIIDNKIINGPSFQQRTGKNVDVLENIVIEKGTPKVKKKIKGSVFSLLTGGGGNANYWHWLFDVLPRLKIIENQINQEDIDYFLFPDLSERFQKESLESLNISKKKLISSKEFRHIDTDLAITVDHPYVIKNQPTQEIQNIPIWILNDLREKFLTKKSFIKLPSKIYIDRSDSKSNHSHLRKIINEKEIKDSLRKKGFSIICLSDFSFLDQVNMFKNAKQIIGLHGAGFANLVFCKANTFVLEFKSSTAGSVIGNLARKLNLNFHEIAKEPIEKNENQQGSITIPIKELEQKLID